MIRRWMAFTLLALLPGIQTAAAAAPNVPTARMLARFGLERAWLSQAIMDVHRDRVRHVQLDEDSFYVQSTGGTVTAFDAETGRKRWAVQLGQKDAPSHAVTSNATQVLVIAGSVMYALDKFSGDQQWELRLENQPSTSPAMDNFNVYYGTLDGSLYAYDLKKVRELHEQGRLPQFSMSALRWRYKSAGEVTAPPVVAPNNVLNFASRDSSLYSLTTIDRKLQWQFETDRPLSAPLGRSEGMIFLASEDFNVFCIREERGSLRWQFVAGLPVKRQPRILNSDVYVFPERGGMYCLSKENGHRRWWQPNLVDYVGATRRVVYVSTATNDLVALSRRDGTLIGSLPLSDFSVRYGNEQNDRLYLATPSGQVMCLRETGNEFPTYHMFPERQPLIPEFAPEVEPAEAAPTEADPAATTDSTTN